MDSQRAAAPEEAGAALETAPGQSSRRSSPEEIKDVEADLDADSPAMSERRNPSPYDAPELYDLLFEDLDFDIPYWLDVARTAGGPLLEAACGTGRVLLRLRQAGFDADGFDGSAAMIRHLLKKAVGSGLSVRAEVADMRRFDMGRRYARVFCAFNGFAHVETVEDQVHALACSREHLLPGGAFIVHMSYPGPGYWSDPDGGPYLEREVDGPAGGKIRLLDSRTKDPVGQRQDSVMEVRELDAAGRTVTVRRFMTSQRWVFYGGFDGRPLASPEDQMVAWAYG
jgi:SAM-dependent methyltransferase